MTTAHQKDSTDNRRSFRTSAGSWSCCLNEGSTSMVSWWMRRWDLRKGGSFYEKVGTWVQWTPFGMFLSLWKDSFDGVRMSLAMFVLVLVHRIHRRTENFDFLESLVNDPVTANPPLCIVFAWRKKEWRVERGCLVPGVLRCFKLKEVASGTYLHHSKRITLRGPFSLLVDRPAEEMKVSRTSCGVVSPRRKASEKSKIFSEFAQLHLWKLQKHRSSINSHYLLHLTTTPSPKKKGTTTMSRSKKILAKAPILGREVPKNSRRPKKRRLRFSGFVFFFGGEHHDKISFLFEKQLQLPSLLPFFDVLEKPNGNPDVAEFRCWNKNILATQLPAFLVRHPHFLLFRELASWHK